MSNPVLTPAAASGPIGVFDSGMGGLTVLRALRQQLPNADFLYLGDTARLPYGTKSPATVQSYALQTASLLIERGVCALVIACNTASVFALDALRKRFPELPIFGVIEPGADAVCFASKTGRIGVLATESTVASNAYQRAILARRRDVKVFARPAPVLVALAEATWTTGDVPESVVRAYLDGWLGEGGPDSLLLGCTHFPALIEVIRKVTDGQLEIVDSAETTASVVARALGDVAGSGAAAYLATDSAERFSRLAPVFLGEGVEAVEAIDL